MTLLAPRVDREILKPAEKSGDVALGGGGALAVFFLFCFAFWVPVYFHGFSEVFPIFFKCSALLKGLFVIFLLALFY